MTEEQQAKEKEAVNSMRAAKANMEATLSRVGTLEAALLEAAKNLEYAAKQIPDTAFPYRSEIRTKETVLGYAAKARKHL